MLSLKPSLISRYVDIARLLMKYGRSDLAAEAGLPSALKEHGTELEEQDQSGGPESLARDLEERGPTFIKLGQLLSTRSDLLPQPYLEALTRLQDDVECVPVEEIRQVITEELGVRISRAFSTFDEKPLSAASLGQVHRAALRDGREVVVKVQRPGVRSKVMQDLEAMTELADFFDKNTSFGRQAGLADIVASLHDTIIAELDYRQEAENARNLAKNLEQFKLFRLPQPISDFVSSRVITMEYVAGVKITDVSPAVLLELDGEKLADELFRIYLHQVLVDGLFHSDPHPGNLFLAPDHGIALMDFGMVTRITPQMRQRLLKLLLSISEGEGEEAARVAIEVGRPRESFQEDAFVERIATLVSEHQGKSVERLEAGQIVMEIQGAAGKYGLRVPHQLTMLGKTLLNLDKVVSTLSPGFNPNEAMRARASEIMKRQTESRVSLTAAYHSLLEATEFAQNLPARANRIVEQLANNQFTIKVEAIDEKRLMAGMQKIANRITTGLVLAALIVGASMLMRSDSTVTFVIATIFFIFAAIFGLILVFRAMFGDESRPKPD